MPIIDGKSHKKKGTAKMKKENKWRISHDTIYHPNREERLRKAYEVIVPEIVAQVQIDDRKNAINDTVEVKKSDSIKIRKKVN